MLDGSFIVDIQTRDNDFGGVRSLDRIHQSKGLERGSCYAWYLYDRHGGKRCLGAVFLALLITTPAAAQQTMTDEGIQLYCEHMMRHQLGHDAFWVMSSSLSRIIADTATRSVTYMMWENDHQDVFRADCVVHDDRRTKPSVMMVEPSTGNSQKLEVEE